MKLEKVPVTHEWLEELFQLPIPLNCLSISLLAVRHNLWITSSLPQSPEMQLKLSIEEILHLYHVTKIWTTWPEWIKLNSKETVCCTQKFYEEKDALLLYRLFPRSWLMHVLPTLSLTTLSMNRTHARTSTELHYNISIVLSILSPLSLTYWAHLGSKVTSPSKGTGILKQEITKNRQSSCCFWLL